MKDLTLYILMRNDLTSMNAGKAMAQASHASNKFIHQHGKIFSVKKWTEETEQGFGTVLVLSADWAQVMHSVTSAQKDETIAGFVYDPTYPYIVSKEVARLIPLKTDTAERIIKPNEVVCFRKELTCGYIFGQKEFVKRFVKDLPLHP